MTGVTLRKARAAFYSTELLIWLMAIMVVSCVAASQWIGALGFAAALFANLRAREIERGKK